MALVRSGSLNAAAQELGVSYTTVSRRVAAAEASFGTKLFIRRADGYAPTEAGLDAANHAAQMELAEAALRRRLEGREAELTGAFVVTAPQLLIATVLAPAIKTFAEAHPGVELTLRGTNNILDLDRRQADLAIRISREPGDALVGRRLVQQDTASFATPELVEKMRADPSAPVDWLGFDFWTHTPKAALPEYTNQRIRMRFDDMSAVVGAAQAGLGVARMPLFLGNLTPGLIRAPILPPQPYTDIWVLTHRDLKDATKVRAFKAALVPHFARQKHLFTEREV